MKEHLQSTYMLADDATSFSAEEVKSSLLRVRAGAQPDWSCGVLGRCGAAAHVGEVDAMSYRTF